MAHRRHLVAASAAAAMLIAGPALAASNASAAVGPLVITLVDLDPLDAIAPSITFDASRLDFVGVTVWDGSVLDFPFDWGTSPFDPISLEAMVPHASAGAAVSGDGSPESTSLTAWGSSQGESGFSSAAILPNYSGPGFTLSASTVVLITASANLTASVTHTFDFPGDSEHAEASAWLRLFGPGANGSGDQDSSTGAFISVYPEYFTGPGCPSVDGCWGPSSDSFAGTLAAWFANTTAGNMDGYFHVGGLIEGYSNAPVPEPQTWALLMGGLGLVTFAARRRKT